MKGMRVYVMKSACFGDCTNGGASATADRITVSGPGLPDLFEARPDEPAFELVPRPGAYGPILVPVERPEGCIGPMFGGNYGSCSDSRWAEALRKLGIPGGLAIPIHDRFETPAQYRSLSS